MSRLPRLAAGIIQPGTTSRFMLDALSGALLRYGISVQRFASRAAIDAHHGCASADRPRHLDSWLMDQATCREVFAHGTPCGSLGLVEGTFDCGFSLIAPHVQCSSALDKISAGPGCCRLGGSLETLCDWLDLPRLVVLDVSRLCGCALPKLPAGVSGLLLDGVNCDAEAARLETLLFAQWGVPVLATLKRSARLRDAVSGLSPVSSLPADVRSALANHFSSLRLESLMRLAQRSWTAPEPRLFCPREGARPLTIAVAHDEVFGGYFQETLDVLELRGARLEVFSPLRDDKLPPETDVVYLGCGHPERHARALTDNSCLMLALRQHLCSGRRIYGEGGGMAYLCQQIQLGDGSRYPMVGALPAVAQICPDAEAPDPVELTLNRDIWLGEGWSRIRGYRSSRWQLIPSGPLSRYAAESEHQLDLVGRHQAIGSRIHINFAAQLDYLDSFFQPHAPALDAAAL